MAAAQPPSAPRVRAGSQYELELPTPHTGAGYDDEAFATIVDEGLGGAERELLYAVRDSIDRYEPIRACGSCLELRWRDGTVVVAGRVRSQPLKVMAERLAAAATRGRPLVSELISDADVVIAVATALALDGRTNLVPVYVESSLGIVRLSGSVPSAAMAAAAAEIASAVPGVAEVRNELEAAAESPPSLAEQKVEAGAASQPSADTAFTSEPRLEPHGRTQDADQVTRPQHGDRVPVADT